MRLLRVPTLWVPKLLVTGDQQLREQNPDRPGFLVDPGLEIVCIPAANAYLSSEPCSTFGLAPPNQNAKIDNVRFVRKVDGKALPAHASFTF